MRRSGAFLVVVHDRVSAGERERRTLGGLHEAGRCKEVLGRGLGCFRQAVRVQLFDLGLAVRVREPHPPITSYPRGRRAAGTRGLTRTPSNDESGRNHAQEEPTRFHLDLTADGTC